MPHSRDLLKTKRKVHPNSLKAIEKSRKPFVKGDPRINRKGAPNTTSAMRALIRDIGADLVQLSDQTLTGRKRTHIVSRMTKKILDMYNSPNPADSIAILKAGYPGLLTEEKETGPKELVLKIVYENKRVIDREEELVIDAEEAEPGEEGGGGQGGGLIIAANTDMSLNGLDILQHEIDDSTFCPHGYGPGDDYCPHTGCWRSFRPPPTGSHTEEETYCVLCKQMRPPPARSSAKYGGWICSLHKEQAHDQAQ